MRGSNRIDIARTAVWAILLPLGLLSIAMGGEATRPDREWTDIDGRTIAASYVDSDAKIVRLKKQGDARVYSVPLERLSEADRKYIRGLAASKKPNVPSKASDPEAAPSSVAPHAPEPVGPPPSDWDKVLAGDIERATRLRPNDPVSAFLLFKGVLEREKDGPTPRQKKWLAGQLEQLRPTVLSTVQGDFKAAAAKSNLLDMLIAKVVGDRAAKGTIDGEKEMKAAKDRVFRGEGSPEYVWQVEDFTLQPMESPYKEGDLSIASKPGFRLVRAKARVTNISKTEQPPYTLFAFEPLETAFVPISCNIDDLPKPFRWLDDSFVCLLTPELEVISCSHVIEGSDLRRGLGVTIRDNDGGARVLAMPQAVKSGETIKLDVLFSVPKDLGECKLLVFGAAPVAAKQD